MTCLGVLECMDLFFSLCLSILLNVGLLVSEQCFTEMTLAYGEKCSLNTLFSYLRHCFGGQFLVREKPWLEDHILASFHENSKRASTLWETSPVSLKLKIWNLI